MIPEIFLTHFICDNALDPTFAEEKFNVYTKDMSYFNDNNIKTKFANFKELPMLGNSSETIFWLTYEYGHNLFMRGKYMFLDSFGGVLVGRKGETLPFGSGHNDLSEQEFIAELTSTTCPPANELKLLFDYILSINTHFYILLSLMPFDEEMDEFDSFPCYHRGDLMEGRKIVEMNSEAAQTYFIECVGKWYDELINYKWTPSDGFPTYDSRQDPLFQAIFKITKEGVTCN